MRLHRTDRRSSPWVKGRGRLAIFATLVLVAAACGDPDSSSTPDESAVDEDAGGSIDIGVSPGDIVTVGKDINKDKTTTTLKLKQVDPTTGKASGGYQVTLYGTGFESDAVVLVDNVPVDADHTFYVDSAELQITMPPHTPGLASIEVQNPGPEPPKTTVVSKLEDVFLYYNDVAIAKVDPAEGPVGGGSPITITGSGFSGKTKVLVGGKPAIGVQVVADDEIIAVTPPGIFGSQPVHVINDRGTAVMKKGFFYYDPPSIQTILPAAGPTGGGTESIIEGNNFTAKTAVWIGEAQASVLGWYGTGKLKIATPPGTTGKADVKVVTKYGAGVLKGGFVYTNDKGTAPTKVLSVAPPSGPVGGGQVATVIAHGLISKDDTTILFGNKTAKIKTLDPVAHTAVVTVPAGKLGLTDVKLLTTKGSDTAKGAYKYIQAVQIKSISPAFGPPSGNTKVTIKGAGFAKGKPMVRIGALPAKTVVLVSDNEIQAVTPPGSPGYVHVAVEVGGDKAVLHNGFAYSGDDLGLYVVYPDNGAQAGGTKVHIYGGGFEKGAEITFDGKPASHVKFVDPTHMTAKTPPGKVGVVNVAVKQKGKSATLAKGFTYFNPMSKYGGTWGAAVDGTVNLTVLDASNGKPVPDAFTMLWTDPATPHQGFTDANGQITFSGDDVLGTQMISASKPKYESASVVKFNATNVTLYINPIPEPSPGAPPPGTPLPLVSGKVVGLDKYVIIPAGSCNEVLSPTSKSKPAAPHCNKCLSDSQCGSKDFKCIDIGGINGKRCVSTCAQGQACPTGFFCQPQKIGGPRCVPQAGELTSVCYHSKPTFLSRDNWPPVGPGFEAKPANNYSYTITTGFGEMAIVCFGGYKKIGSLLDAGSQMSMFNFTPTVMGVKRHLFVQPGTNPKDVHIKLNIPLSRKANLRFENLHKWPIKSGEHLRTFARAYLVLGSDGVMTMLDLPQALFHLGTYTNANADRLEFDHLPAAFVEEIFDSSLTFMGMEMTVSGGSGAPPYSVSVIKDVKDLNNDAMIHRKGKADFESIETGVARTIYDMWGTDKLNVYAVGAKGAVFAWSGNGWTQQATFTQEDVRGIHGLHSKQVYAVGNKGAAGVFDGVSWKKIEVKETSKYLKEANFSGVFAVKGKTPGQPDVWVAANQSIFRMDYAAGGLKRFQPYVPINAWAIHGADANHIWAVGYTGRIVYYNGQIWKQQQSGTSIALRGVWAASPKAAWAVGESGQILRWTGLGWIAQKSPTTETLQDVWGTSEKDVWAVGAAGTVVHYDGNSWKLIKLKELHKSLHAAWSTKDGDFFSMGAQELLLGPILYPPLDVNPLKNGQMKGNTLKWKVDPNTTQPHFNYITIGIPAMGGDIPVWNIMTDGDLTQSELPDFPKIQGTPGIPTNTNLRLTIIRGFKEGFDIDAYDLTDMNIRTWRSWAENQFFFTKK